MFSEAIVACPCKSVLVSGGDAWRRIDRDSCRDPTSVPTHSATDSYAKRISHAETSQVVQPIQVRLDFGNERLAFGLGAVLRMVEFSQTQATIRNLS